MKNKKIKLILAVVALLAGFCLIQVIIMWYEQRLSPGPVYTIVSKYDGEQLVYRVMRRDAWFLQCYHDVGPYQHCYGENDYRVQDEVADKMQAELEVAQLLRADEAVEAKSKQDWKIVEGTDK